MKSELQRQVFEKKTQIPRSMKIRPVKTEFFSCEGRTNRQADMMKLRAPFRSFAIGPRNESVPHRKYTASLL